MGDIWHALSKGEPMAAMLAGGALERLGMPIAKVELGAAKIIKMYDEGCCAFQYTAPNAAGNSIFHVKNGFGINELSEFLGVG